jgi:site-specific DNA-methyltransferase (adenine-specific)
MTNVLPGSPLEKDIAAFPDELAYRIIKLFTYEGETVLDPFLGSGTVMKVARRLRRNSLGIEIKKSLLSVIQEKLAFNGQTDLYAKDDNFEYIVREGDKYGAIC